MGIAREYVDVVLKGGMITFEQAVELYNFADRDELFKASDDIRKKFASSGVDTCTIANAKSGNCSEDCKFCAQSSHYNTGVKMYPLIKSDEALHIAKENEAYGVNRFSLVTSGNNLTHTEFEEVLEIYKLIGSSTRLSLCASLGSISYEQALRLKDVGVHMYHHNVETSSDYYPFICTTHSYEDRVMTIKNVMKAGMKVCSGGIIGMGESAEQRIRMAFELKELGVRSVPLNILNPIQGTPMYDYPERIEAEDVLKTFAVVRFILPDASIRYAAGRSMLGDGQRIGFRAGVNGVMVGNFLTTVGGSIEDDMEMIRGL